VEELVVDMEVIEEGELEEEDFTLLLLGEEEGDSTKHLP